MFKKDFPIFANHPELVYLDSAATAQKPTAVIEAINSWYQHDCANVHRGIYDLSEQSTSLYESAREKVRHFIDAETTQVIVFTKNATEALNLLAFCLGRGLQSGDRIIVSIAEHHSNIVPWQQIARLNHLELVFVRVNQAGELDLGDLQSKLNERVKVVSLTHCSNVLGTISPIAEVKKKLTHGGSTPIFIVDATQSLPHIPVSARELGCDYLVFSGHKLYGPSGIGVLFGRVGELAKLPPYQTGGHMINEVTTEGATWNTLPWRLEAGTPPIEQAIGLGAAIDYLEKIGMTKVKEHNASLTRIALAKLSEISPIHILGQPNPDSGIISFTYDGIHPHDLAELLNAKHICIRAGQQCAAPLHHHLGISASNRISFGLYNTEDDIAKLLETLAHV